MKSSSIIRNTSSLFIAHLAGRILAFILTIVLPRYLEGGFSDLGKYFTALWLANLLATLTELGLYTPLIREVAADRSKASQMISNALVIRLILSFITFLIIIVPAKLIYSEEMASLIYIVGLSEIINALAQLFRCIFRSFERMGYEALGVIVERFVVFSLGLGAVIWGYGIVGFCVVVLIASILNLTLTLLIMMWKFARPSLKLLDMRLCGYLLKQALPFALGGAVSIVYFRIDGLMLKHVIDTMGGDGDIAMGWYGTAYSFANALTIIPGAFMGAVFPVMSRMYSRTGCQPVRAKESASKRPAARSTSAMDFLYTKSLKLMFIIALPIAVGVSFSADKIVLILYPVELERFTSQDHEALSRILEILIWAGALTFLNTVLITVFRAANKRRAFLIAMIASMSANIVSNLILIPEHGHLGPPISMIISESIIFAYGLWYVHRYVCKLNEFGFLIKSAFTSGFLALGLFVWKYAGFSESMPIALVICLAIIGYLAVLVAMKGITREDIAMVKGQFHGSVGFE
jgi:O-antigen/teichoic acid export membrane protein